MRMYDVYRHKDLVARIRVGECRNIEWAYRQEPGDWQGFWWSNEIKGNIDDLLQQYPELEELNISEFTLLRCGRG